MIQFGTEPLQYTLPVPKGRALVTVDTAPVVMELAGKTSVISGQGARRESFVHKDNVRQFECTTVLQQTSNLADATKNTCSILMDNQISYA